MASHCFFYSVNGGPRVTRPFFQIAVASRGWPSSLIGKSDCKDAKEGVTAKSGACPVSTPPRIQRTVPPLCSRDNPCLFSREERAVLSRLGYTSTERGATATLFPSFAVEKDHPLRSSILQLFPKAETEGAVAFRFYVGNEDQQMLEKEEMCFSALGDALFSEAMSALLQASLGVEEAQKEDTGEGCTITPEEFISDVTDCREMPSK